jgi:hypothetical protein
MLGAVIDVRVSTKEQTENLSLPPSGSVQSSRRWTSWMRRSCNSEAIDVTTYGWQRDKLREELTLAKIDSTFQLLVAVRER